MSLAAPLTLSMAITVLGEPVSSLNGIGIMIVLLAPIIMVQRESKTDTVGSAKAAEGYFFAFIAAMAFGCSPVLIRGAIGDTGMGIAGALVAYSAAAVPLMVGLAWPGRLANLRGIDMTALRWFMLSAVTVFFTHLFRFAAFDLSPLTVVEPLLHTGYVWTVIFSFVINRQIESFKTRVLVPIAMSIVGSVLVVL
jgi:drug/metabolite transporter (DMT)-like permease